MFVQVNHAVEVKEKKEVHLIADQAKEFQVKQLRLPPK